MGFFDILMKAIGFEEEQKPEKEKGKKNKKTQKVKTPPPSSAHFNLNTENIDDKFVEKLEKEVKTESREETEVKVFVPKTQKEIKQIADILKEKRPIMVNFAGLDDDNKVRAIDFLSGAIYVLNGKIQKLEKELFFFSPEGIEPMEFEIKK